MSVYTDTAPNGMWIFSGGADGLVKVYSTRYYM
jgi:hypothetical protein